VQLVWIHRHYRVGWRKVLGTQIAKTLHPRLDRTETERIMRVRLEGMANDAGTIKFEARAERQETEFG
jgi:hypothetical protein